MNKENLDVLSVCFEFTGRVIYNMNQAYMVAYLRKKKIKAEVYVSESILPMDELIDQNYRLVRESVKRVHERQDIIISIIATGPAVTYSSDILLNLIPGIDKCINNDNEGGVYRYILNIQNKLYVQLTGLSAGTITRLNKNEPISVAALLSICNALNCDIGNICSVVRDEKVE